MVGYRFNEEWTAIRQIERLDLFPNCATDCIISHLDNDHIGGLSDFPNAVVHVGMEEYEHFKSDNPRYLKAPLSHNPKIITYEQSEDEWYGFEARKVAIDIDLDIFLIPLFGHTNGHCGVAIRANNEWLFYVSDAYYLRAELHDDNHRVNELAIIRADDNDLRITSLNKIRSLVNKYPEITVFGYHDVEDYNP